MKYLRRLPKSIAGCAVTIGTFDGLHRGHRKVIQELRRQAKILRSPGLMLTFSFPPRQILNNGKLNILLTGDEKLALLRSLGLDIVVSLAFGPQLSRLSAEDFFRKIIVERLRAKTVVVGYNFAFGYQRQGGISLLRKLGKKCQVKIKIVSPVKRGREIVSSTLIRRLLRENKVEKAAEYLGYNYNFGGRVIRGRQRGRELGFPTANILLPLNKIIPSGVFAAEVRVGEKFYPSVVNIGFRPTFGREKEILAEAHIFNFFGSLYRRKIRIFVLRRLREEKNFSSSDQLKQQINQDIEQAKNFFKQR
ncbi:MAG: bifunctional riboflavin kinase/FAD synthetase [Elusimicrobiota bacterium]